MINSYFFSKAAKLTARITTLIAEKHHHRSSIHHIWYKICSEEYENKMGKIRDVLTKSWQQIREMKVMAAIINVGDNDQRNTTTFFSELITTTLENKEMYERSTNSRI